MSSNMHDVVRRLQPGHVVSWSTTSGRYTYIAFVATNRMVYTTATSENTYVPQVMTLTEFANLLDNEGASLFLATNWEVQDAIASSVPSAPPAAMVPRQIEGTPLFSQELVDKLLVENTHQLNEQIYKQFIEGD